MEEEQLIKELEKLGWNYVYLCGHGDTEAVTKQINGERYVVGDVEKSMILVPKDCMWDKPIKENDYY